MGVLHLKLEPATLVLLITDLVFSIIFRISATSNSILGFVFYWVYFIVSEEESCTGVRKEGYTETSIFRLAIIRKEVSESSVISI